MFNTLFVYENYPEEENKKISSELSLSIKEIEEKLDYPLGVIVNGDERELRLSIRYASELFDEITIEQLLNGIKDLLFQFIEKLFVNNQCFNFLSSEQRKKILLEWNQTNNFYFPEIVLHNPGGSPD